MARIKIAFLLAVLAGISTAQDWSWGSEDTAAAEPVAEQTQSFTQEIVRDAKAVEIAPQDFNVPLPLEPHSLVPISIEAETAPRSSSLQDEEDRQGRFLGLSDTLCGWGIGVTCDNKIKKKGHAYAPSIDSQYGVPSTFGGYDSAHGSSSYASNYATHNTYDTKVKGHHHKGNKKGGVTDLISGFLNSYTKPKPAKGYHPSKLPTYIPPSQPLPSYGAPIRPTYIISKPAYTAPKPAYVAPSYSLPKYDAPKFFTPKPIYNAPKPSYVQPPTYVAPQKPKYVHLQPKVTKVITHTVQRHHEPTKVQHLHSHTHVYHGAQVIKPGETGYVDSHQTHHAPSTGYNSHFQKKSDDGTVISSSSDNFNEGNSFLSSSTGNTFGTNTFNSGLQGSGSININHNINPFNTLPTNEGNVHGSSTNGFTSHSTLTTNNQNFQQQHQNGFQNNQFRPSASEHGFKPSVTIEEMLNQNHIASFSRTIYRTDCHCVSAQYCSAENIVTRNGDFGHLIDARNKQDVVYSNDTDASGNVTVIVEPVADQVVDSEYLETDEIPYVIGDETSYVYYDDVVADDVVADDAEPTVERRRRDVNQTEDEEANFSDVEGRQLTGYTPGASGCGAGTVCCRRPVYSPARSLPVCGVSNDENIHGRIKTKHEGVGQASFGEYPWQAAILKRTGGEMVYVCGATLVSDQYLITAAHCIKELDASTLKVRLGEWDVRAKTEFYPHVEFEVSGIYTHPEFYEGNLENDITILRIAKRINFSKYPHIGPACLPPKNTDFTSAVCRITGWGKDGWGAEGKFQAILKETDVPVIRKDLCEQILKGTKLGASYSLHKGMMCAGGEENKDACKGDGGGPLVCKASSGEYHLAGVVSWGIGCGERGIPGVYVDVPYYSDWIQSIIRN